MPGMRKRQIFVEAVKGTASTLTIRIERQNFFNNLRQKVNVWSIIICEERFLKACASLRSRSAPTLSTQKMNHVAYQP